MSSNDDDSIYQKLPRKPNFGLILILSGVTILIVFLVAYLLLSDEGRKLMPHPHQKADPNAQVFPARGSEINA